MGGVTALKAWKVACRAALWRAVLFAALMSASPRRWYSVTAPMEAARASRVEGGFEGGEE